MLEGGVTQNSSSLVGEGRCYKTPTARFLGYPCLLAISLMWPLGAYVSYKLAQGFSGGVLGETGWLELCGFL